jgi:IclR family transcriptional regulator, acetate operon repressor
MSEHTKSNPKPILLLQKARRILDCLDPASPELTFTDIVTKTGMPATTCHRLLHTMVTEGFLSRVDGRYRSGSRLLSWAAVGTAQMSGMDLTQRATVALRELRDLTGETACLYVRDGLQRSLIAMVETRHSVMRVMRLGEVRPLHAGSGGKLFLAYDEGLLRELLSQRLTSATRKTVVDKDALRAELAEVRRRGYATSFEEREIGVGSISAPVFDRAGEVIATIGIIGPIQRLNESTADRWIDAVTAAGGTVSEQLAGAPAGAATLSGAA